MQLFSGRDRNSKKYNDLMGVGSAFLRVVLWSVTALFLFASGYLVLNACGTSFPSLNYCVSEPISTAQALRRENRQLLSSRDDALARLNRASQCDIQREEAALPEEEPEEEPMEDSEAQPENFSACQVPPADDVLVLLDGSASMGSDYETDPALSQKMAKLNEELDNADLLQLLKIRQELAELEEQSNDPAKINRMDVAKDALRSLVANLTPTARLKLMSFAECGLGAQDEGSFTPEEDPAYRDALDGIALRPSTALAEALAELSSHTQAGRAPDRPVNIVIMSDGVESCRGDPCAAAAKLKAELPYANVSVLSLAPVAGSNACIAEKTGGRLFEMDKIEFLKLSLRRSVGQLSEEECVQIGGQDAAD